MHLTVDEASKRCLASHKVIQREIEAGRLAGLQKSDGSWLVDAEALFERYDAMPYDGESGPILQVIVRKGDPAAEVAQLRELLQSERERAAELRADRDRWAAQAERLISALAAVPTRMEVAR